MTFSPHTHANAEFLFTMDVVPVPQRLKFDGERLRAYLEKKLPGFACKPHQLEVRKFKRVYFCFAGRLSFLSVHVCRFGESNPTYYLRASSGEDYVLRRQPPGKLLPGAHRVGGNQVIAPPFFPKKEKGDI